MVQSLADSGHCVPRRRALFSSISASIARGVRVVRVDFTNALAVEVGPSDRPPERPGVVPLQNLASHWWRPEVDLTRVRREVPQDVTEEVGTPDGVARRSTLSDERVRPIGERVGQEFQIQAEQHSLADPAPG
jgi:hypothetical protein